MQKHTNTPKCHHGFTLVELRVTIKIIVNLAMVALLGGRKLIDSASKAKAVGDTTSVKFTIQVVYPNKLVLFFQRILDGSQHFAFLQPEDRKNGKVLFSLYGGAVPVGFYDGHVNLLTRQFPRRLYV